MNHVHYDLTQVEAQMRKLRAEVFPQILAAATEVDRQAFLAQDALWEPCLALQLGVIRMVNEGRAPTFVGKTLGSIIGNVVLNAVTNSADPDATLQGVIETWNRVIVSHLGGDEDEGVTGGAVDIVGERGGRA